MAIKGPFCRLPPPSIGLLSTPTTTTKNKTAYVHFHRVSQSAYWSELDILSLRCQIQQLIPPCPYPATIKKKKKRLCIVFELFCLVNNFMIWKRKKKEKKKTSNGGGRIRSRNLWITKLAPYHWATETNYNHVRYKVCIYIQYGISDHTTFDLCNPTIPNLIKITLSNA